MKAIKQWLQALMTGSPEKAQERSGKKGPVELAREALERENGRTSR